MVACIVGMGTTWEPTGKRRIATLLGHFFKRLKPVR